MMNRIFFLLVMLLSHSTFAETIKHKGQMYKVEIKEKTLKCPNFRVSLETRSMPFQLEESKIPHEITMGHSGLPHLLSQSLTFASGAIKNKQQTLTRLKPDYERIDPARAYSVAPVVCVGSDSVIFSFWGGGNCKTVCEAWALVTFSATGQIKSSKGLAYSELKKYN